MALRLTCSADFLVVSPRDHRAIRDHGYLNEGLMHSFIQLGHGAERKVLGTMIQGKHHRWNGLM